MARQLIFGNLRRAIDPERLIKIEDRQSSFLPQVPSPCAMTGAVDRAGAGRVFSSGVGHT